MSWFRHRHRNENEYDIGTFKIGPAHMALSCHLMTARELNASALIFGIPDYLPPDVKEEANRVAACDHAETMKESFPILVIPFYGGPKFHAARDASAILQSSAGWANVPRVQVWLFMGFLRAVQERLVSLNATEDNPQPCKYIEFWSYKDVPGTRQFAEVELWLDSCNALRIEILGFRNEPSSVRVSQYVQGY